MGSTLGCGTNIARSNENIISGNDHVEFKNVTEIFRNDANDKSRFKKEAKDIEILFQWYSHVYLTINNENKYDKNRISEITANMIRFIPQKHFQDLETNTYDHDEKTDLTECEVCYMGFDDNAPQIVMEEYCDHSMICSECFKQHLQIKIKDDDITPWILCPAQNCKAPICCDLLLKYLDIKNLYKFAEGFIRKHLARNSNWIPCQTKNCKFGWMILDNDMEKQHTLRCKACNKSHVISKDPIKSDKGFNELINNGILRLCPKCRLPTMKDKGMCNIMHCGKCGIFWNWRTYETGTSSSALKNKARCNGTLWERGELRYQQQLQKNNLPEFIKLLERNGIKYNPNYVRGSS